MSTAAERIKENEDRIDKLTADYMNLKRPTHWQDDQDFERRINQLNNENSLLRWGIDFGKSQVKQKLIERISKTENKFGIPVLTTSDIEEACK